MTILRARLSLPIFCTLGAFIGAATPAPPDSQPSILVKAHELHVGNGDVIPGGMVLIQNERIAAVGADLTPPQGPRLSNCPAAPSLQD